MISKRSSGPWAGLTALDNPRSIALRLVGTEENPNERRVFWGMAANGRPALVVEYECDPWQPVNNPLFKNISVEDHRNEQCLVVALLDPGMSDFFYKVCADIIAALQDLPKSSARRVCILRLERWSNFLRQSQKRLSEEQQKGLIAELLFLERDAMASHHPSEAVSCWVGPDSSPRDFEFGQSFVEVKSKRSSSNNLIKISSESQLASNDTESLFLVVMEINRAAGDDDAALSINDVVRRVRGRIDSPIDAAVFDGKLAEVGYFDEDDYSNAKWTEGETIYYEVIDGFPRIVSADCAAGIQKVSYEIDLSYCHDFEVKRDSVIDSIG